MTTRKSDLPEYDNPPVDEVILGIQFQRLDGFSLAHVGEYWSEVKDRYPRTEDQPPLITNPVVSVPFLPFPVQVPPNGLFRVWLLSTDDTSLLQIQNDRFLRNWRRRDEAVYPRFETLFRDFVIDYDQFEGLYGPCQIEQVEVSYINWLPNQSASEFFRPASGLTFTSAEIGAGPEAFQWASRYQCSTTSSGVVGSLSVQCNTARRQTPFPPSEGTMFNLTFTAPCRAREEVEGLLGLGRDIIVRSFTDLTSDEAHLTWGRTK